MRLFSILLGLCLFLGCLTSSHSVKQIVNERHTAVFRIGSEHGSCTSFHIGQGLFVTAGHCITEIPSVLFYDKVKLPLDVVLDDDDSDIALFKVPQLKDAPALGLDFKHEIGERIVTIGYPGYALPEKTFEVGYLMLVPDPKLTRGTQIIIGSDSAFPGMSGGPVLNEQGNVIGIVSAIVPITQWTLGGGGLDHFHKSLHLFVSSKEIRKRL